MALYDVDTVDAALEHVKADVEIARRHLRRRRARSSCTTAR